MSEVVWIVPAYPSPDGPTGGVFYQTQARALARLGVDIAVACPTPWAPWPLARLRPRWRQYRSAPARRVDGGVLVVRPRYVGVPGEPRWAAPDQLIARAAWRVRDAREGAQIIHGHSAITGLAAWRLSRRSGLPFVLTFHGSDLNTWPVERPDRIGALQAALTEAAAVITVSPALAERAEQLAGVKPVHLPLGSDHATLERLALPRGDARRALGLEDRRIVVLFVGNLLPAKGVRELADAILARSDRFLAVFVGAGPLAGYGQGDSRGAGALQYRGARPHEEVPAYMSAADVLVLPSRREGLPTVLVEAGSLRIPVIASAVGGVPDLLADDRGRLIADVSAESIGRALDEFELSRYEADARAARLHAFVRARHDVDTNARALLEIYRSSRRT